MAKTWKNRECTFHTANNTNKYGDSKYTVTKDKMKRHAPVNTTRAPNQVNTSNPSIAYLDPNSELYRRIMKERDDSKITVKEVIEEKDVAMIELTGFVAACSLKPIETYNTFDFVNNDGVLSNIHVGHAVKDLTLGTPKSD